MAKDEHHAIERAGTFNRRDVLVGGAAAAVAASVPGAAAAPYNTEQTVYPDGSLYHDVNQTYTNTFRNLYLNDIETTRNTIVTTLQDETKMWWGNYQQVVAPSWQAWGTQDAYTNWPYYVAEVRNDLRKQPANDVNSLNPTQAADNLLDQLDKAVQYALWDHAVPITINVGDVGRRHHRLTTSWTTTTPSGNNPGYQLSINIDCPMGGWQGYAQWPAPPNPPDSPVSQGITKFVAKWTVPDVPKYNTGSQIIFIFNGLESVSGPSGVGGILQPVLQWTQATGWAVRNFYMRADFDPSYKNLSVNPPIDFSILPTLDQSASKYTVAGIDPHTGIPQENRTFSQGLTVATGHTITGTMTSQTDPQTKLSTCTCSFAIDGVAHTDLDLHITGIPELISAVCAVESYYVVPTPSTPKQDFYPTMPIKLSNFEIDAQQAPANPIPWTPCLRLDKDFNTTIADAGATVVFTLA